MDFGDGCFVDSRNLRAVDRRVDHDVAAAELVAGKAGIPEYLFVVHCILPAFGHRLGRLIECLKARFVNFKHSKN